MKEGSPPDEKIQSVVNRNEKKEKRYGRNLRSSLRELDAEDKMAVTN
jgi:hypothetical protein